MVAALTLGALVTAACGDGTASAPPVEALPTPLATPSLVEIAPELLGTLPMLGPCPEVTDPEIGETVDGIDLPETGFFASVTEQGGLLRVQGYVELTPILFQLHFRENPDLEILTVENEIQESETLYSDGIQRVYLKAAAICELGSSFIAVVAPEGEAEAVPTPTGPPN